MFGGIFSSTLQISIACIKQNDIRIFIRGFKNIALETPETALQKYD
jgi:hypothetical protein